MASVPPKENSSGSPVGLTRARPSGIQVDCAFDSRPKNGTIFSAIGTTPLRSGVAATRSAIRASSSTGFSQPRGGGEKPWVGSSARIVAVPFVNVA